jgi:hypothetical protein
VVAGQNYMVGLAALDHDMPVAQYGVVRAVRLGRKADESKMQVASAALGVERQAHSYKMAEYMHSKLHASRDQVAQHLGKDIDDQAAQHQGKSAARGDKSGAMVARAGSAIGGLSSSREGSNTKHAAPVDVRRPDMVGDQLIPAEILEVMRKSVKPGSRPRADKLTVAGGFSSEKQGESNRKSAAHGTERRAKNIAAQFNTDSEKPIVHYKMLLAQKRSALTGVATSGDMGTSREGATRKQTGTQHRVASTKDVAAEKFADVKWMDRHTAPMGKKQMRGYAVRDNHFEEFDS